MMLKNVSVAATVTIFVSVAAVGNGHKTNSSGSFRSAAATGIPSKLAFLTELRALLIYNPPGSNAHRQATSAGLYLF